jgi:hypothetical protein
MLHAQDNPPPPVADGTVPRPHGGASDDASAVWQGVDLRRARQRYLRDWSLVKRVRFNAAKRLERKHAASQIAFAFAAVLTLVVPQSIHHFGGNMATHTRNVIEYYTYVASSLALVFGLIEQARGYDAMARQFHDCGRQVNAILRRLRGRPTVTQAELDAFVAEYERALDVCQINHDQIDFDRAALEEETRELQRQLRELGAGTSSVRAQTEDLIARNARKKVILERWATWRTYRLYIILLSSPVVVAVFAYFAFAPA